MNGLWNAWRASGPASSISLTVVLIASALGACGSLEEIGTSRSERDAGGSAPSNGGPASPVVDSSTPPSTGDGGSIPSMDARVPAIDAGFLDSGTVVDGSAALPDTGPPTPPPPQRVVFVHVGHGFGHPDIFTPAGSRSDPVLVNALEPLAPFVDRTLVIDGIVAYPHPIDTDRLFYNVCGSFQAYRCPHALLSGMARESGSRQPRTVDHRLAEWFGLGRVREPLSLGAAVSLQRVSSAITSYNESERALVPQTNPARYLDALIGPSAPSPPSSEAAALLTALQTEALEVDTQAERVRFFARATAAKIAFGVTRVATVNLAHPLDELSLPGPHFPNTIQRIHHDRNIDAALTLMRWYLAQVAELVEQLDRIPEGGGSVLDNTLVVFVSDSLRTHNGSDAPAIVVGGGASTLRRREYVSLGSDGNKRMIDVLATIVSALGMNIDGIGPPDEPARILPELLR